MHFKTKKNWSRHDKLLAPKSSLLCCRGKKTPLKVGLCLANKSFTFPRLWWKWAKFLTARISLIQSCKQACSSVSHLLRNIIFLSIYFQIFPLLSAGEKGLSFSLRRPSLRSCRLTLEDKVREWPCVSKEEAVFQQKKLKGPVLPELHFVQKLMFSTKTPNKVHP